MHLTDNFVDYFKAVNFAFNRLEEEKISANDKTLEKFREDLVSELREHYGFREYQARDAIDDAVSTYFNKKKIASSDVEFKVKPDLFFLASKLK